MERSRDSRLWKFGLLAFFIVLLVYAYYEAGSFIWGPRITVPADTIIVEEPLAAIRGRVQNVSELRINGAAVQVTEDGYFDESVVLMPGENRFVFDAQDKYGRTRQESVEIVYRGAIEVSPRSMSGTTTEG